MPESPAGPRIHPGERTPAPLPAPRIHSSERTPESPPTGHKILTDELLAAALGPEARPDADARAPRFFRRELLERLTRAHPASPYLLHLPIAGACIAYAATQLPAPRVLALVALGWLAWSLVEYWLHRSCFHMRADGPARRVTSYIVHRHHHAAPRDRERLVATPLYSLGLLLLLLAVYSLAGPSARWALLAGSALGYLAYEAAHWRIHHAARPGPLVRALRRRHLRHHFADPAHDFGISSPLWDLVFRTWRKGPVREDIS